MAEHENHGGGGGGGAHGGGDAHGGKPHKKHERHPPHEEHEEKEEWVISFADNALLQMGFFVILLAMNMKPASSGSGGPPAEKSGAAAAAAAAAAPGAPNTALLDSAIAIREAFNSPVNMSSNNPNDLPLIKRIIQKKEGESKADGPPGQKKEVSTVRPTDYHRIGGKVSFEENSSEVDRAGQDAMAELSKDLRGRKSIVEVRGHTSLAESAEPADRGLALSFQRALAVAGLLRAGGLEWEQIRVVAVGAADRATPIARTSAEQRNNQRVEVILTDETLPNDPYAMDPSGSTGSGR
jgi:flagellar motor protein MotB